MKAKKVNVSARKRRLIVTALVGTSLMFSSCGVTKAWISRPAEGTQTTVTITTNNPISTDIAPDITISSDKI